MGVGDGLEGGYEEAACFLSDDCMLFFLGLLLVHTYLQSVFHPYIHPGQTRLIEGYVKEEGATREEAKRGERRGTMRRGELGTGEQYTAYLVMFRALTCYSFGILYHGQRVSHRSWVFPKRETGDAPEGFADHGGRPPERDEGDPMQFESEGVLQRFDESPREPLPLSVRAFEAVPGDADGHAGDHEERRRDRQPFKVFRLARLVLGDEGDGGVEPGEAGDPGADKDEEGELVERGAEPEGKGGEGGRDAERDRVGERVEFLSEHRTLLPPARDLAVEGVKDEAGDGVREGAPEELFVVRDHVLRSREEGQGAAEAVAEGDDVGEAEVADEAKVAVVFDKLAQFDLVLSGGGLFDLFDSLALGGLVCDGDALSAGCEGVGRLGVGSGVDGSGRFRRGLSGRAGDGRRCQICGSSCVWCARLVSFGSRWAE